MKVIIFIVYFMTMTVSTICAKSLDSTSIAIRLKAKQSTGIYYYDNNYQNRRMIFQNASDSTITVTTKVFLDRPTEFRHSTNHSVAGKSISTLQHFYLEPGSETRWVLKDNYDLVSIDDKSRYGVIEMVDKVNLASPADNISFNTKDQLTEYLGKIKIEYEKNKRTIGQICGNQKITDAQGKYWEMAFECDYIFKFFKAINQSPKLQIFVKTEIDDKAAYFLSRLAEFQKVRFVGTINASSAILYYKGDRNYNDNFDIITAFALKNLGETAVPNLFIIMNIIPEIGNEKYKKSIVQISNYSNPLQRQYLEIFSADVINNPENYLLKTKDNNSSRTLKEVLDGNKGKLILIDFWASWCVPCRAEMPVLKQIEEKFKDRKIAFIGISLDENNKIDEWLEAMKVEKIYTDSNQYRLNSPKSSALLHIINLHSIPKYVLLDIDGKILNKDFTRPSAADFEAELERYLKENAGS